MPISAGSSEVRGRRPRLSAVSELVGRTPLLTLQRSGDGHAHVKHEGMGPGGSFFDRVARLQLDAVESGAIVCEGASAWTVSVAQQAAARGLTVHVFMDRDAPRRVVDLVRRFGADVRRVRDGLAVTDAIRDHVLGGAIELERRDVRAHLSALRVIRAEVETQLGGLPARWVAVDYGVDRDAASTALGAPVSWIRDDDERARPLFGTAAARRTQMGHREGLLVSPVGAEVTDRTVNLALGGDEHVVGVAAEGGHRYLGWW